jgi:hypothetical protein
MLQAPAHLTMFAQPPANLVGIDSALARQTRHRGARLHAQRHQLRLRRPVVHAAPVALVTNHQSALEILQFVCHYVPAFVYVGT